VEAAKQLNKDQVHPERKPRCAECEGPMVQQGDLWLGWVWTCEICGRTQSEGSEK
jgi:ribosomal protein L37AE/L43A